MKTEAIQIQPDSDSLVSLAAIRHQHLAKLRAAGLDPYKQQMNRTHSADDVLSKFTALDGQTVTVAGRVIIWRDHGKSVFFKLRDSTGVIQVYLAKTREWETNTRTVLENTDVGDLLTVTGKVFRTKTGETTVALDDLRIVAKCLQPPPLTWHGLEDEETKMRQRYVHMIADEGARKLLETRFRIVAEIRTWMAAQGYLEVETPMLETIAGGAAARPFKTHHNALGCDLFLRIAPELRLKRLLVGGFEKIFELNRNFRNEGISRKHNPEFSMMEAYEAGGSFESMAELIESLVCHLAEKFCGGLNLRHQKSDGTTQEISLARPWRRERYHALVEQAAPNWSARSLVEKQVFCKQFSPKSDELVEHELTQLVFEHLVEAKTTSPIFVTHLPKLLVPLAKQNAEEPHLVDVYELIVNGQELSPGYSEQNDPIEQRLRLEEQVGEEVQNLDEDFLNALSYGMPPAGGMGVGIDRLVMLLLGAESIRDVIAFPTAKPK